MTTSAQIRSAWETAIWEHATVIAMTDRIYDYDLTFLSTKETARLRYEQEINFFQCLVSRGQELRISSQIRQLFTVSIIYARESNVDGSNYHAVIDNMETVDGLIQSQLGTTWSGTVDYYQLQNGPPTIQERLIDSKPVWVSEYKYLGFKNL